MILGLEVLCRLALLCFSVFSPASLFKCLRLLQIGLLVFLCSRIECPFSFRLRISVKSSVCFAFLLSFLHGSAVSASFSLIRNSSFQSFPCTDSFSCFCPGVTRLPVLTLHLAICFPPLQ